VTHSIKVVNQVPYLHR